MPDLCLTLAERSFDRLQEKILTYRDKVPAIEVRLDFLKTPRVPSLGSKSKTQFIATCRPTREGGKFSGSEKQRLEILKCASQSGFDWIDLEHDAGFKAADFADSRVIRSLHCFDQFPEDLSSLYRKLAGQDPDLVKLSVFVHDTDELTRLLGWMESLPEGFPRVVLGMGELGEPSRLLGAFLGNYWTYVAESADQTAAPGQFTLAKALVQYRLDQWSGTPDFYGVLGLPVSHSQSPRVHNRLFETYRLKKLYLPVPVDDLDAWFRYVAHTKCSFRGFSVTLPYKREVERFADFHPARGEGINTLAWNGADWEAANTDLAGFLKPLQARLSLQDKIVLVLGNGGVAHTVVQALQQCGASVTVAGRSAKRVRRFAAEHQCQWMLLSELPRAADICINATPVGQFPDVEESLLVPDQLQFELVYDLVYNPEQTRLLKIAEEKGIETISGIEMFIEQAALQFEIWTSIKPDRNLIWRTLKESAS